MLGFLMVFCTCPGEEEARALAAALIARRVAACVNVLPPVQSIYRWHGKIESASECMLLIKTTEERFGALRDAITELHSYETPEIVAVPVSYGSDKYLAWIRESV